MRYLAILFVFVFALPAFALEVSELKNKLPTDYVLGKDSAKVTVIEYASLSCPHCADFHAKTLPSIKKDYIDTGKVQMIYRDFPLDAKALAGSRFSNCAGKLGNTEKYYAALKLLFEKQKEWTAAANIDETLLGYGSELSLERKALEACFADKELAKKIVESRAGGGKMGVQSTPSFFINGEATEGFHSPAEAAKVIDAVLAGKTVGEQKQEATQSALTVRADDLVLGKDTAKVTLIEYLNIACPHCGSVHKMLINTLKKDYIDTGKVRLVFRELPLGNSAFHAYMLARCKGKDAYFDTLNLLIENNAWAGSSAFMGPLRSVAEKAGITKEAFYTCMEDKALEAPITATVSEATGALGINHSPTIFINGDKLDHVDSATEVVSAVDAALKK